MNKPRLSDRGFAQYGEITVAELTTLRLVESSMMGDHLSLLVVKQGGGGQTFVTLRNRDITELIALLQKALDYTQDPEHWKNDPQYLAEHGE